MSWLNFFFGFKGRIGRLQFHLGALAASVFYLPTMYALWRGMSAAIAMQTGQMASVDVADLQQPSAGLLVNIPSLIALYMMLTLNAKRLHDLGKSGWWQGIAFVGLPVELTGLALMFTPGMSGIGLPLVLGSFVFSIWGMWIVIQIWLFAGAPGSNDYGPPPGAGLSSSVMSEIEALEASQPVAGRVVTAASTARAEPTRVAARTPAIQTVRPSGFGRRGPRIA